MEVLTALRSARRYELGKDELAGDVTSPRQWGDAETRARAWEFVKQVLANVRWLRAALELVCRNRSAVTRFLGSPISSTLLLMLRLNHTEVGETSYSAFLNAAVEHAGYRSGEDEAPGSWVSNSRGWSVRSASFFVMRFEILMLLSGGERTGATALCYAF